MFLPCGAFLILLGSLAVTSAVYKTCGNYPIVSSFWDGNRCITCNPLDSTEYGPLIVDQQKNTWSSSCLMNAVIQSNYSCVRAVLMEGTADIEARSRSGRTMLAEAVRRHNTDITRLLLDAGAYVETEDDDGDTPLIVASSLGLSEQVDLLLNYNALPSHVDRQGNTPLHIAARLDFLSVCEKLYEHGADVNAFDSDNRTALYIAAEQGHFRLARKLVEYKAAICTLPRNALQASAAFSSELGQFINTSPTPPGYYLPLDDDLPQDCSALKLCPAGSLCPGYLSFFDGEYNSMHLCDPGYYQDQQGQPVCKPCPIGTYGPHFGMSTIEECIPCPPGTSCREGSPEPMSCLSGTYQNEGSREFCRICPEDMVYSPIGSMRSDQCESCQSTIHGIGFWNGVRCLLCQPYQSAISIRRGFDYGASDALIGAASRGDTDCVLAILGSDAKYDINTWDLATNRDVLMLCALNGDILCVEKLLSLGADQYKKDTAGNTALSLAAFYGHYVVVIQLIQNNSVICYEGGSILTAGFAPNVPLLYQERISRALIHYLPYSPTEPGYYFQDSLLINCSSLHECNPGSYCKGYLAGRDGFNRQEDCVRGEFQDNPGQTDCKPCQPGYYNPNNRATECMKCPEGTYTAKSHSISCFPCNIGTYSDEGSERCIPCDGARQYTGIHRNYCQTCPIGWTATTDHVSCRVETMLIVTIICIFSVAIVIIFAIINALVRRHRARKETSRFSGYVSIPLK